MRKPLKFSNVFTCATGSAKMSKLSFHLVVGVQFLAPFGGLNLNPEALRSYLEGRHGQTA